MKTSLSTQLVCTFIRSAGAVLFGLALSMILANLSVPGLARPRDPILELPVSSLFWALAGLELVLAWVCLFRKDVWLQTLAVLWLSSVFIVYWFGLKLDGVIDLSLHLASLADTFALSPSFAFTALKLLFLYLFIGSAACLVWLWREGREEWNHIRGACNHCGGHIQFPSANLGRLLSCPHCEKAVLLRKPENLRMACFFCHGHIEFPSHALGEKLKCPHCKMDITLKELA